MWHSLVLLVLCVTTNAIQLMGVESRWPYLGLWIVGLGFWASIFWNLRRRSGPVTAIERQIAHVWGGSMAFSSLLFALESIMAQTKDKSISLTKDVKGAIKHAIKQVHKKSKTVTTLTDAMIWFFAFGLIGLGMQITKKAISQAGGWPLAMGIISGVTKAVLSFFDVWWLVKDVVLK